MYGTKIHKTHLLGIPQLPNKLIECWFAKIVGHADTPFSLFGI